MSPRNAVWSGGGAPTSHGDLGSRDTLVPLERRLSAVIQRIDDAAIVDRVARTLLSGEAQELFAFLIDDDARVRDAAHECTLLRYGYVAAIAAAAVGFDRDERDELVQRTFMSLPQAVARARDRGMTIPHPVGWLRRRAYLIAREMRRDEHGAPSRAVDNGSGTHTGHLGLVRGQRVSLEQAEHDVASPEDILLDALDTHRTEASLASALDALSAERPLWADILRLHYIEGCQLDDVATRLGRAHGTIRNLAREARTRLGEIIRARFPHLAGAAPSDTNSTIEPRPPRVLP